MAGLALAFVYHGLYDFILLSTRIPSYYVLPLVLLLWIWLLSALTRIRRGFHPDPEPGRSP